MALSDQYLVAGAFTDEGELVGSALAIICLDIIAGCQPWAMIENVITTERVRGQGVGSLALVTSFIGESALIAKTFVRAAT